MPAVQLKAVEGWHGFDEGEFSFKDAKSSNDNRIHGKSRLLKCPTVTHKLTSQLPLIRPFGSNRSCRFLILTDDFTSPISESIEASTINEGFAGWMTWEVALRDGFGV